LGIASQCVTCVTCPCAWIVDSVERLVRRNKFEPSKIFNFDPGGTVDSRAEGLSSGAGMLGFAWNALREGVWGEHSVRLLLVRYETLTANPLGTLAAIYGFIGEPLFTKTPAISNPITRRWSSTSG
jgi:sulfotransferase